MSKQRIENANAVWAKSIASVAISSDYKFVVQMTLNDISLISFALGCALGMEWGIEDRDKEIKNGNG